MVVGVTVLLQVPLPVPVTVPPPLLKVKVQAPVAVMLPDIGTLTPLQVVVSDPTKVATALVLTITCCEPVRFAATDEQFASTKDAIV